jgi:thiosulfate/3-mercaptopyruvate sulfurtransferase
MTVLVDAVELAAALDGRFPPVVLDVRWALGDPYGREHYRGEHITGAVYVDLGTELAAPPTPAEGRHPLPDVAHLQESARRWGIHDGDPVVVYDDVGGTSAARAWWLLRWGGLTDVRLLDGGLGGWRGAGLPVESGDVDRPGGDVRLRAGQMPTADADGAAQVARDGALLDARAGERYRGEVEPVDPVAGHIPGAISAPTSENLRPDGRFLAADDLRARFERRGVAARKGSGSEEDVPVAVYCGSGVTAAHQVAALAVAGVDAALYPGSWSQWSNDPTRPVATGREPG